MREFYNGKALTVFDGKKISGSLVLTDAGCVFTSKKDISDVEFEDFCGIVASAETMQVPALFGAKQQACLMLTLETGEVLRYIPDQSDVDALCEAFNAAVAEEIDLRIEAAERQKAEEEEAERRAEADRQRLERDAERLRRQVAEQFKREEEEARRHKKEAAERQRAEEAKLREEVGARREEADARARTVYTLRGAFSCNLIGTSYIDPGEVPESRQQLICELVGSGRLAPGQPLTLEARPARPYNERAVAVFTQDGRQLGYLPKDRARGVYEAMARGVVHRACVTGVTCGGVGETYYVGVKVESYASDACIEAASRVPYQKGDIVEMGRYPQGADGEPTPIEWIVSDRDRDGRRIMLIARYGLEAQPFHHTAPYPGWEKSDLRAWLNGAFLSTAFTPEERRRIVATDVRTPDYAGVSGGKPTLDRVFLLSREEVGRYFFDPDTRLLEPTARLAQSGYAYRIATNSCRWWLRSPGGESGSAAFVDFGGSVGGLKVSYPDGVVRPVIVIDPGEDAI